MASLVRLAGIKQSQRLPMRSGGEDGSSSHGVVFSLALNCGWNLAKQESFPRNRLDSTLAERNCHRSALFEPPHVESNQWLAATDEKDFRQINVLFEPYLAQRKTPGNEAETSLRLSAGRARVRLSIGATGFELSLGPTTLIPDGIERRGGRRLFVAVDFLQQAASIDLEDSVVEAID
jgi:hypothetical protein